MTETLTLADIADLTPVNAICDHDKVKSLTAVLAGGTYTGPAILYHGPNNAALTGSHRIFAARAAIDVDDECGCIDVPAIDVSDEIEAYCESNDCTWDQLPFADLRHIFKGTNIEDLVKNNAEW